MSSTRWFATGAAAVAVVLGGGVALAAGGSSDPASDFLGDVAERLGISEDRLEDAIEHTTIARIDADVAAGKITKAQGEALKERVRSGEGPVIVPSFRGPDVAPAPAWPPERGLLPGFPEEDLLETAADYLGMGAAELREAVRDGKSLAALARDRDKSVEGLKNALHDAIREDADRVAGRLSAAVDELVETGAVPGMGFAPGGPGLGFDLVVPAKPGVLAGGPPGGDLIGTAVEYLGMDRAEVREAARDGKSLADVAKDKGKSPEGLKTALRDAIRNDAHRAVENGMLTKQQADRLVDKFGNAVDRFVESSLRDGFDFEFGGGGRGFGLHLRIAPEGRLPAPRGPGDSSFGPSIIPPQPI